MFAMQCYCSCDVSGQLFIEKWAQSKLPSRHVVEILFCEVWRAGTCCKYMAAYSVMKRLFPAYTKLD